MESLNILNNNGIETNEIVDREEVHEKGLWHREVEIWVFNDKGEILLQRRSSNKKMAPNKLSICAGHVASGDNSITTAQKELFEEIGLNTKKENILFLTTQKKEKIFGKKLINRIFNDVYFVITDQKISDFKIQEDELSEIFWINYIDFKERLKKNDEEILIKINDPEEKRTITLLDQVYSKITH